MNKLVKHSILFLIVAFCFGAGFRDAQTAQQTDKIKAPAFSIRMINGEVFDTEKNLGSPQVIVFWSTRCPYCVVAMRRLKEIYNPSTKARLVAISLGEPETVVRRFVEKNNINFPIAVDRSGMTGSLYNVYGIPTIVVIDEKGDGASYGFGITKEIEKILKE